MSPAIARAVAADRPVRADRIVLALQRTLAAVVAERSVTEHVGAGIGLLPALAGALPGSGSVVAALEPVVALAIVIALLAQGEVSRPAGNTDTDAQHERHDCFERPELACQDQSRFPDALGGVKHRLGTWGRGQSDEPGTLVPMVGGWVERFGFTTVIVIACACGPDATADASGGTGTTAGTSVPDETSTSETGSTAPTCHPASCAAGYECGPDDTCVPSPDDTTDEDDDATDSRGTCGNECFECADREDCPIYWTCGPFDCELPPLVDQPCREHPTFEPMDVPGLPDVGEIALVEVVDLGMGEVLLMSGTAGTELVFGLPAPTAVPLVLPPNTVVVDVAVADFDGSGSLDLALSLDTNIAAIVLQTSPGEFEAAIEGANIVTGSPITTVQWDDEVPDLVAASSVGLHFFAGLGDGTFADLVELDPEPAFDIAMQQPQRLLASTALGVRQLDGPEASWTPMPPHPDGDPEVRTLVQGHFLGPAVSGAVAVSADTSTWVEPIEGSGGSTFRIDGTALDEASGDFDADGFDDLALSFETGVLVVRSSSAGREDGLSPASCIYDAILEPYTHLAVGQLVDGGPAEMVLAEGQTAVILAPS